MAWPGLYAHTRFFFCHRCWHDMLLFAIVLLLFFMGNRVIQNIVKKISKKY